MVSEFKIKLPKFTQALADVRLDHPYLSELASAGVDMSSSKLTKRSFQYNWTMLQDDYANRELLHTFNKIKASIKNIYPVEFEKTLVSQIDEFDDSLVKKTVQIINKEGLSLESFFIKYKILRESRLGLDIAKYFFETCEGEDFEKNADAFIDLLQRHGIFIIHMISHYLNIFNPSDYIDQINEKLLSLYGEPTNEKLYNGCLLWSSLDDKYVKKFCNWLRIKEIKEYFNSNDLKLSLWSNYFPHLKLTKHEDDGILIIELPSEYVVVDFADQYNKSYLYKRSLFDMKYKQYLESKSDGIGRWQIDDKEIISLKDAQIRGISKNLYIITYEGAGRLYTMEIIEGCIQ